MAINALIQQTVEGKFERYYSKVSNGLDSVHVQDFCQVSDGFSDRRDLQLIRTVQGFTFQSIAECDFCWDDNLDGQPLAMRDDTDGGGAVQDLTEKLINHCEKHLKRKINSDTCLAGTSSAVTVNVVNIGSIFEPTINCM